MIFNFVIHHILLYKKGNIRYGLTTDAEMSDAEAL